MIEQPGTPGTDLLTQLEFFFGLGMVGAVCWCLAHLVLFRFSGAAQHNAFLLALQKATYRILRAHWISRRSRCLMWESLPRIISSELLCVPSELVLCLGTDPSARQESEMSCKVASVLLWNQLRPSKRTPANKNGRAFPGDPPNLFLRSNELSLQKRASKPTWRGKKTSP